MDNMFIKKHGSTILTCMASIGVIGTTLLAIKATPKAKQLIDEYKKEEESSSKLELSINVAKEYAPAILVGTGTIFCIIGANMLNKRQQASLISAYTLLDKSYGQYKNKLIELYGKEAHENIVDSIAVENAKDMNLVSPGICYNCSLVPIENMGEKRLFYDEFGERYFESTMELIMSAEYHLNRNFVMGGCTTLEEYYYFLGLEPRDGDAALGWDICDDGIYWIDFNHRLAHLEDGTEYISISMPFGPSLGWEDMY